MKPNSKPTSDRTSTRQDAGLKPDATRAIRGDQADAGANATANKKPKDAAAKTPSAADAKPAVACWPFAPGSQGDQQPLTPRPAPKTGWNARQFRI